MAADGHWQLTFSQTPLSRILILQLCFSQLSLLSHPSFSLNSICEQVPFTVMKLKSHYHLFEIRFQIFILLLQFRQSVICHIRLSIRGILKNFLFNFRSNLRCADIGLHIMIIKIIIRLLLDPDPAHGYRHSTQHALNTEHRNEASLAFQSLRQTFTSHFFLLSVSLEGTDAFLFPSLNVWNIPMLNSKAF